MCIVRNEHWVALFKNIFHTDASEMLLAAVDSLSTSATLFRSWDNANSIMFENVATEIVCDLEAISQSIHPPSDSKFSKRKCGAITALYGPH